MAWSSHCPATCMERLRKTMRSSVSIANASSEIWTKHQPNINAQVACRSSYIDSPREAQYPSMWRNSQPFIVPDGSLPCSQELPTVPLFWTRIIQSTPPNLFPEDPTILQVVIRSRPLNSIPGFRDAWVRHRVGISHTVALSYRLDGPGSIPGSSFFLVFVFCCFCVFRCFSVFYILYSICCTLYSVRCTCTVLWNFVRYAVFSWDVCFVSLLCMSIFL
jgi:hypothetical protein